MSVAISPFVRPERHCNCECAFTLCALPSNSLCAKWATFPDTEEGREAAKKNRLYLVDRQERREANEAYDF
jgi:hypothetical protein